MEKIKVVVKEPGEPAEERIIDNTLKAFQTAVGGFIEAVPFAEGVTMIVNEEGKILGLMPNLPFRDDIICGTVVFVGTDGEDFADCPMSAEEIRKIYKEGWWYGATVSNF